MTGSGTETVVAPGHFEHLPIMLKCTGEFLPERGNQEFPKQHLPYLDAAFGFPSDFYIPAALRIDDFQQFNPILALHLTNPRDFWHHRNTYIFLNHHQQRMRSWGNHRNPGAKPGHFTV